MISSSFESPKYPVNKGIVRGENKVKIKNFNYFIVIVSRNYIDKD